MNANNANKNKFWQVTFTKLPTSVDMLSALSEANLKEPHYAAALLIPTLCIWGTDQNVALEMINFLKGDRKSVV